MTSQESSDHEGLSLLSPETMQQLYSDLRAEDCKSVFDDPSLFGEHHIIAKAEVSREPTQPPISRSGEQSTEVRSNVVLPTLNEFDGIFGFGLDIGKQPNLSKSTLWCYAADMNRLYVQPHKQCQLAFVLKGAAAFIQDATTFGVPHRTVQLYIRATPVYTHQLQVPVERCPNHLIQDAANDHCRHFVWSDHPLATYCCRGSSLSTVVPYQCGCDEILWKSKDTGFTEASGPCRTVWYGYSFKCLSTCSGSLNRRPVSVIFALESSTGEVLGRRVIELKVCTCPGRDMVRDRKSSAQPAGAREARRQATRASEQNARHGSLKRTVAAGGPSRSATCRAKPNESHKLSVKPAPAPPQQPLSVGSAAKPAAPAVARCFAGGGGDAYAEASASRAVDDTLFCIQVRRREHFEKLQRIANLMCSPVSCAVEQPLQQQQRQQRQLQPLSYHSSVSAPIYRQSTSAAAAWDGGNSLSTDSMHSDSDSKHSSQPFGCSSAQMSPSASCRSKNSAATVRESERKPVMHMDSVRQAPTVERWLESLGLAPYTDDFVRAGYRTMTDLEDARTFGAKDLQKLRICAAHSAIIWKSLGQWRMQL